MRKSFVALALLVGAATMVTTLAFAQEWSGQDLGAVLRTRPQLNQAKQVTKAARLGTSAATDTMFVGHVNGGGGMLPWHIGTSLGTRPDGAVPSSYDGSWDFDNLTNGAGTDSAQGWHPYALPGVSPPASMNLPDQLRSEGCLDWGNRMNAAPVQGRTPGIISAWHADNGVYPIYPVVPADSNRAYSWTPLAGSMSAWCGLRAGDDFTAVDDVLYGGTGNHINGNVLFGRFGSNAGTTGLQGGINCITNFPGYAGQWDQMLYRDVRVADGAGLTVAFLYRTEMDNRRDGATGTCKGWFDRDPLSLQQGGSGPGMNNFISASANIPNAPIDSFMVYVGVPTDPTATVYSDYLTTGVTQPIFDLKRRWFSEVIAVDKPYKEILSTFGKDSVYKSTPYSAALTNADIQPMIDAQGTGNGGGVIRVVFRIKTNFNFGDDTNTGGSFVSTNQGAVRIDQVDITGCTPAFTTSGFENPGEINNTIEGPNSASPGPAVGEGYALNAWHATGKPPKLMAHLHPLTGDVSRGYDPLNYADLCGAWDSPSRQCDINGVVVSATDHDLFEASGGADGTPFKDNQGGYMGPAISLVGFDPITGLNACGLDAIHVNTTERWLVTYDMYTGLYADLYSQASLYTSLLVSYPTLQKNGAKVWGQLGVISSVSWWGDRYCFKLADEVSGTINTSNASGIPDSVKVAHFRQHRSIQFGTGAASTDGDYKDNISLAFPPTPTGATSGNDNIIVDIWDWYGDAFPRNEGAGLTGTAAFDTCGALIFSAFQRATQSTTSNRANISGDSMFIQATVGSNDPTRMDCIFRVYPGPGNYMTIGDRTSAMRKVPSVADAAVAGDASFWGQYMQTPGEYSKGVHTGSRWNVDTWNSIRCDTVENNIFPAIANNANLPAIATNSWMSTIHDDDSRLGTLAAPLLGIPKNRCFLLNPAAGQVFNSTNITCDYDLVPPGTYGAAQGYDGNKQTLEYTKIFPDGLLTPGSSIQYFFRMGPVGGAAGAYTAMIPDTNMINPQTQMGPNFDGLRWAHISVLPDKWKDESYGGLGKACMLVVDLDDRRGNERYWVGIADSIGATVAAKYGAHNGWHQTAGYVASDGSNNYNFETNCGTDPNIAVASNGGQPGTTWDLYNVVACETSTGNSSQFGGRLAPLASGLQLGKDTKKGPTASMLNDYYESLFIMTGDMVGGFLGKTVGVGADDIALIENFLLDTRGGSINRGVWFMGDGFVDGNEYKDAASYPQSGDFFYNWLGVYGAPVYNYYSISQSDLTNVMADLLPTAIVSATGTPYGLRNPCTTTHEVNTLDVIGEIASTYGNHGPECTEATPCIAGIYTSVTETHPYFTLVDGWDLLNLLNQDGGSSLGRLGYFMDVSTNVFGSSCGFMGTPTVDVPTNTAVNTNIDFLGNVWNNPVKVGGNAIVNFGLAKSDLVDVKVYDVTGRLVKTLANRRAFKAGPNKLVWDGRNDQGQMVSRGVYFTQVKFINSGFVDAKKVTVLK